MKSILLFLLTLASLFSISSASAGVERIWLTHQSPDPSKIVVSWQTAADVKIDLSALKRDDVHLLLSSGDTAMQHQFCEENQPECVESHGALVDTQAELFRTTPFLPTLGNLDRKIRPKSDGPEKPAYEIPATAYRNFFALPGKEWIWTFAIPEFDLQLVSVEMNQTCDFGTPDQSCHPFGADSEQLAWYRGVMEDYLLITVDQATGAMKVAVKNVEGTVLDEQTIAKKAR